MEKNIEIEFKALLTKEEYLKAQSYFEDKGYSQTNYYFDTHNEKLRSLRITLRVRLKNNEYEFTLKRNGKIGLDEYNEKISQEDFNRLVSHQPIESGILELLNEYDISLADLHQIYSLTTYRQDMYYHGGILSLDKSQYLNHEDYEIEYEVIDPTHAIKYFNLFLSQLGITYVKNCKGKRHRLCDVLYKKVSQ